MSSIKHLSTDTIQKIAAGEVIETPANVIKELVENALDAQATNIKIILETSGLDKIIVTDNGCGMDQQDLVLASQAHTTSKLKKFSDLQQLKSFGFRGEALASIAQISHLKITSKVKDQTHGFSICNHCGKLAELKPTACPEGSTIIITHLFENYPARKKFIKSSAKQLRLIIETITALAIAHPDVRFDLSNNQKNILNLPQQNLYYRARALLGKRLAQGLLKVDFQENQFTINGFISHPQLAKNQQVHQYLLINHRPVKNSNLIKAIKLAYGNTIKKTAYPSFMLSYQLPPELIDANIHPKKLEVGLAEIKLTQKYLTTAVKQSLSQADLIYHRSPVEINKQQKEKQSYYSLKKNLSLSKSQLAKAKPQKEILQINNLYLLLENDGDLILIDQHAAHERVLYEQLLKQFEEKNKKITTLKKPILLELTAWEAALLEENKATIRDLGFELQSIYTHTYQLNKIPQILAQQNLKQLFSQLLSDLKENQANLSNLIEETIHYLACRSAIKDNQYLNPQERLKLVKELLACEQAYTCPHGRPTMIKITERELAKMFKRK